MKTRYLLSIDQGTTSSRAVVFSVDGKPVACVHEEFTQHYPDNGWVEHDPADIWRTVLSTCKKALAQLQLSAADIIV